MMQMMQMLLGGGGGGGFNAGGQSKSKGRGGGSGGGSNVVFVRGFDFGTTEAQLTMHMSQAGNVQNVEWMGKGEAEVTFGSPKEANMAKMQLNGTTIMGNSRFID